VDARVKVARAAGNSSTGPRVVGRDFGPVRRRGNRGFRFKIRAGDPTPNRDRGNFR